MSLEGIVSEQPRKSRASTGSDISSWVLPSPSLLLLEDPEFTFLKEDGLNVRHSLQCLTPLDTIFLEQMNEEGEKLPGMELENQYVLKNVHGQRILLASENTSFCFRCCLGSSRPFQLNVYSDNGMRVMNVERQWSIGLCCVCGLCCGNEVEVCNDANDLIGRVRHVCSCTPTFDVFDPTGERLFVICGPRRRLVCCKVNFKIYTLSPKRLEIGMITKQWGGIIKETFSDADTFGIKFPKTLKTELKALLIGSIFLIDFIYFETHG